MRARDRKPEVSPAGEARLRTLKVTIGLALPAVVLACGGGDDQRASVCSAATGNCVRPVTAVAAGTGHTCSLHDDGAVRCWGYGPFIAPGLTGAVPPTPVALPGRATAVAVGIQAACAVTQDTHVHCWGDWGAGPEAPWELRDEAGGALAGITTLAGGSVAFCGVGRGGAVFCWGDNKASELARPASAVIAPHTAVMAHPGPARFVAATVAILAHDGGAQLCGWGNNDSGLAPGARGIVERPGCGSLPDVLSLTAGDGHACARRGGDRFTCWGSNSGGQLGHGDEDALEAALPGVGGTLPGEIATIAAGAYHTCALTKRRHHLLLGQQRSRRAGAADLGRAVLAGAPRRRPRSLRGHRRRRRGDPHLRHPDRRRRALLGLRRPGPARLRLPARGRRPLVGDAAASPLVKRPLVTGHRGTRRSRRAFAITDTELRLMAALASMGLISRPKAGYRTPAAMGTPSVL